MRIEPLIDHPDLIPTIARWHWEEWGTTAVEGDIPARTRRLRSRLRRDGIPAMFVAIDGDTPLGTSAVVANDMDNHPELSPWLANVFVMPSARGRGIGRALVAHAMQQARLFGYARLYLYTHTAQGLYAKLGWTVRADEQYEGHPVTIMECDLGAATSQMTESEQGQEQH